MNCSRQSSSRIRVFTAKQDYLVLALLILAFNRYATDMLLIPLRFQNCIRFFQHLKTVRPYFKCIHVI